MRLIDADRLLDRCIFYHLPNGDLAVPIIDVQHAPTVEAPDINVGNMDTTTHDSIPAKTGKNDGDRTSGDCISRQAVTKFLNDWLSCLFENCHKQSASDLKMIIKDFKNLPSAQPETNCSEFLNNWIPCGERQPDVNGWYVTTISGEICGQDRAFSGMSEFANGKWMSGDDVDETEMTIAWMPLPEPYREGE